MDYSKETKRNIINQAITKMPDKYNELFVMKKLAFCISKVAQNINDNSILLNDAVADTMFALEMLCEMKDINAEVDSLKQRNYRTVKRQINHSYTMPEKKMIIEE